MRITGPDPTIIPPSEATRERARAMIADAICYWVALEPDEEIPDAVWDWISTGDTDLHQPVQEALAAFPQRYDRFGGLLTAIRWAAQWAPNCSMIENRLHYAAMTDAEWRAYTRSRTAAWREDAHDARREER